MGISPTQAEQSTAQVRSERDIYSSFWEASSGGRNI